MPAAVQARDAVPILLSRGAARAVGTRVVAAAYTAFVREHRAPPLAGAVQDTIGDRGVVAHAAVVFRARPSGYARAVCTRRPISAAHTAHVGRSVTSPDSRAILLAVVFGAAVRARVAVRISSRVAEGCTGTVQAQCSIAAADVADVERSGAAHVAEAIDYELRWIRG